MTKTLAQLKRDLKIGDTMILTWTSSGIESKHKFLNIPRYIVKKQTNAIVLSENKDDIRGSWLYFYSAKLIDYKDNQLKIYDEKMERIDNQLVNTGERGNLCLVYSLILN